MLSTSFGARGVAEPVRRAERARDTHQGGRSGDHARAQVERGESAADDHSGDWADHCFGPAGTIADPLAFKSGRELAAWIGLVPRQHSSGGKQKMGRVSKQGDRYLRRLLTVGATAVMRRLPGKTDGLSLWVRALLDRRPFRLVSLALANKMARIAWAIMVRPETYKASAMT